MALTETRPETATSAGDPVAATTLDGILGSADHKTIGRLWIGAGLLFLVASLVITAVAGLEATDLAGFSIVDDAGQFTQLWSLGRTLLLFGGIVPILIGLAVYLVPLQIGAPALAFARGAAGSFWTWFLATDLLCIAYLLNGGPGGGRADFVVLWAASLGAMLAALVWSMVLIVTSVIGARTTGMTFERVPLSTWSFFVFSLAGILTLPVLMTELVVAYIRVRHGFIPLDARSSLTGVLESASLAPAVYWTGIPLLGMAVDIIGVHTSRPIRAHRSVMAAIGLLGVLAYATDYFGFASVRPLVFDHGLMVIVLAVTVPVVLAVLAMAGDSLRLGSPKLTTSLAGALVSGLLLLLGSAVSLLGLAEPVALFLDTKTSISIDTDRLLILNGTTFHDGVRGLVLGAVVVALVAALHHWAPKIWGRRMAEPLGMAGVLAGAAGAVLWGAGAVLAGIDDQPAYPESALLGGSNVEFFNLIALVGMALLAAAAAITALNVLQAAMGKTGGDSSGKGWKGTTLEWATASPPTIGNFEKAPVVRSATPLVEGVERDHDGSATAGRQDADGEEESDEGNADDATKAAVTAGEEGA